jgi:hypothetical protein
VALHAMFVIPRDGREHNMLAFKNTDSTTIIYQWPTKRKPFLACVESSPTTPERPRITHNIPRMQFFNRIRIILLLLQCRHQRRSIRPVHEPARP